MYLKSIEVQGFKSFTHKFTFEFHNGITAIVGPNGSGKSNVADAVRWVLGEQSAKQLRGDKMEDVIFSGTETRGPLSYAYVAITLNNEDHKLPVPFEEVTVARRVYRSGESEYLMNGAKCPLREVKEIFLDTGIGKEGYSIIGQGQIEKILSGKPDERRELFDEAAGIVKHKKRKKETLRNLEVGRQNLQRVNDVLGEMEKQIAPLGRQSEKAREYLRLRERLKTLDVTAFLYEYEKISGDKEKILLDKKTAEEELAKSGKAREGSAQEFDRLEREIAILEEGLEGKRAESGEGKVAIEKAEGEVKVCQAEIASAEQNGSHYEERLSSVRGVIEGAKEEYDKYEAEKAASGERLREAERQKGECEAAIQGVKAKIQEYNEDAMARSDATIALLNEYSEATSRRQQTETLLEQNVIKKSELDGKLLSNKSEEETAFVAMREGEAALREIEKRTKAERKRREALEAEMARLGEEGEALNAAYQEKRKQYHIERTKLDSLKNIMERYEGYGHSVKRIMERKAERPGIVGVVADVLNVRATYETAVETALGGSVQNIVTDTEGTAKACVEYLKKNRYGRATFLPLTNMKGRRTFQSDVLGEPGVMGVLSELVEFEPKYKDLVEYLLGRFLLVDEMDNALALARKYRHTLRIVTLEGELLSPGGSISGGAYRNASNLIGRRREMDEIQDRLNRIVVERQEKEAAIEKNKAKLAKTVEERSACSGKVKQLTLEENTLRVRYEQTTKDKEQKEEEREAILIEAAETLRQRKSLEESMASIEGEIAEITRRRNENEAKINEGGDWLERLKEEEGRLGERALALNVECTSQQQNVQFLDENLYRVKKSREQAQEELDGLTEGKREAERQIAEKRAAIEELQATIHSYRAKVEGLDAQIVEEGRQKEVLVGEQKKHLVQKDELSKHVFELDKEVTRLANLEERWNEQLDSKINYMWEEYELTYHMAKEYRDEGEQRAISQIRKEAEEVKDGLRSLGDVNVNAIEDFKSLSERYETQRVQRDDLVEADAKLVEVVGELDEKMRRRFTQKMKEINEQFDLVFRELFGGGKGSVVLEGDGDVLDAEVRIIPQLPGKRLKNLMQLSGGEKALTAISLLFAIQNLKPSPFCLLDEIEAALDDSNIKRFAKYLHKLKKNTQFIVITHRQGTMEAADALYGITMQEKGISTMVSVKLVEGEGAVEARVPANLEHV